MTTWALSLPVTSSGEPLPWTATEEASWARAAAAGNKAAFAKLIHRHKGPVFGLCLRLLRSRDDAADAAQEAFARAWAGLGDFDPDQPFGTWILRIARNHSIDLLRRRRPTLSIGAGAADPETDTVAEPADPRAVSGEDSAQEREAQRDLDAAVSELPPRYREVIELFHVQHRSYADIAKVLSVPIGTVMTWLHRARKQLRASMAEHLS